MGQCIDKTHHIDGACTSNTAVQVFLRDDEDIDGYCFPCSMYVRHPYGSDKPEGYRPAIKIKTKEDIAHEIGEIASYQTITLHDRMLNKGTLEYFGIKVGLSQSDGVTPETHHYPYKVDRITQAYKNRLIEGKKMWTVGEMKGVDLFGWDQAVEANNRRLFIVEGELDAAALWQMMSKAQRGTDYEDRVPSVVSLTRGAANAAQDITANLDKIRRLFKEVVLVFDGDRAGKDATEAVLKIAPDFMTVDLPEKDANACLLEGKSKAAVNACMWKASIPKNTSLVWGSELHEAGRVQAEWGASYPWAGLTQLTRGMRFGETVYIGAGVKMGKSEVLNALVAHCILEHKWKVFMAKPEESNRKSYQMIVGKAAGRIFHDPEVPFDYDAYDKGSAKIMDNLAMVNLYQHLGWDSLQTDIRAAAACGCKAIFIDPITNLTAGMSSGDANTALQGIAVELSAMAHDLGVIIFIFCHLKAPDGTPHERGGEVLSYQFSGSRSMMRSCNYMIGLEGNKDPDLDEITRNQRDIIVLEDREFGAVGKVGLQYDRLTGMFSER